MTNRRSLQGPASRDSRAFQFVPGHVSGRVASAQPVLRRRTVGAAGPPPVQGVPPDAVRLYVGGSTLGGANLPMSVTMTSPPAGMTSAVALFSTVFYDTITLPAGWSSLLSGKWDTIRYKLAVIQSATGSESLTVTFEDWGLVGYRAGDYAVAYFLNGAGGTWAAEVGPAYYDQSKADFISIPGGSATSPWVQFGAASGVYRPGSVPSGVTAQQGFGGNYCCPAIGTTYTGSAFTTAMGGAKTSLETWDFDNIGAYGRPSSIAFGATWSP